LTQSTLDIDVGGDDDDNDCENEINNNNEQTTMEETALCVTRITEKLTSEVFITVLSVLSMVYNKTH